MILFERVINAIYYSYTYTMVTVRVCVGYSNNFNYKHSEFGP